MIKAVFSCVSNVARFPPISRHMPSALFHDTGELVMNLKHESPVPITHPDGHLPVTDKGVAYDPTEKISGKGLLMLFS